MRKGITFGAFDLVHAGHVLMLREERAQCDYLIVGLHSDPSVERLMKNKPIMSVEERLIILSGSRYVDKIIVYNTEKDLLDILNEEKPDIRIIGADWKGKKYTGYDLDVPVYFNSRNHNYSSTELRERIKHAS